MSDKSSTPPFVAPIEANCLPVPSSHPDEKDIKSFQRTLEEEPLGVGSKSGFGHYDAQFGEVIGPADGSTKYRIERKLGWGLYSSVWLARELKKDRFVAVKIETTNATHLHHKSVFIEVDALALLAGHPNIICPLRDFTMPANRSGDLEEEEEEGGEEHIVVATTLYNGILKKILDASPLPPLPFSGSNLSSKVEFTSADLKADKILVDCGPLTDADIDVMLAADPPRRCPAKASSLLPVVVSQPLAVPTVDDAMTRTFCISDMGAVCRKDYLKAGMKLSPEDLQAPEIIFGAPLDEKVDIWLFGLLMCAVFSDVDVFPPYLRGGVYATKYLNADGAKRRPDLDPAEGDAILAIVLRCLQLDPQARPSAAELLEDPWWEDV
ncbi:hypothetical protein V8D89_011952 [Ganoderma adspersum]